LEATLFIAEISPNGDPRLTSYLLKGFLYEIFNNFGRKIGVFEGFWGGFFLWLIWGSSPRVLWIPIYLGVYLG